jgi:hypothetical protein
MLLETTEAFLFHKHAKKAKKFAFTRFALLSMCKDLPDMFYKNRNFYGCLTRHKKFSSFPFLQTTCLVHVFYGNKLFECKPDCFT